jgi:probable F420-dependent oxidoreductase
VSELAERPVRIGLQLPQFGAGYDDIRRAVHAAEQLGVDVIFNWDHFFGPGPASDAKSFESWAMLGAWAESTTTVELGPLVSCTSYRNPDLVADMARTLDHVSGGRFILGLGAGFKERDYVEYGYDFGTVATRLEDFANALERITRRLSLLNPAPLRHIPILIGGGGEKKMLPLVARYADIWHTFADGTELERKSQVLEQCCEAVGRDSSTIERSVLIGGVLDAEADALRAMGVTLFVLSSQGPLFDLREVDAWLRWRDRANA